MPPAPGDMCEHGGQGTCRAIPVDLGDPAPSGTPPQHLTGRAVGAHVTGVPMPAPMQAAGAAIGGDTHNADGTARQRNSGGALQH